MVINEKGLLSAMNAAWKGGGKADKSAGYKVAVEEQSGVENIMIAGPGWMVVIEKKNVPRKVLALIVEHLGTIPAAGEAYQVAKAQTQTEIFGVAMSRLEEIRRGNESRSIISKTDLSMGGFRLWQRHEDLRVVMVPEAREEILLHHGRRVSMIGEKTLVIYGEVSWGYIEIAEDIWQGAHNKLAHLSGIQWVAT